MKINELFNYANKKSMNYKTLVDDFGRLCVGIEWKNNDVYYWFAELSDGNLHFYERYSRRTGSSTKRYCKTTWSIILSVGAQS
jgi:hypothetical protein